MGFLTMLLIRGSAAFLKLFLCSAIILLCALATVAQPEPTPTPQQKEDVLSIDVSLTQAGVTVLDKSGRFVDGLTADQFELLVDGKPKPISFFEEVSAGSADEPAKLSPSRGTQSATTLREEFVTGGRTVIFFLDDLHMATESVMRARKLIQNFVDRQMRDEDLAAIACASGQLGFLQQLTSNREVLSAALSRLKPWPQANGDGQLPLMSEYTAQAIAVDYDRDVMEPYVQALVRDGIRRAAAEQMVRTRAQLILQRVNTDTRNTLRALDSMTRAVAPLPGRKLTFFVSDGFILTRTDGDVAAALRTVTDAAVRAGVVLYALDARGLATDHWLDAGAGAPPPDGGGQIARAEVGAMSASQEALHFLANQTGGRALLNTNAQTAAINQTIKETAKYYALAWKPAADEQHGAKFHHLDVTIKDHPDLIVLAHRGFFDAAAGTNINRPAAPKSKPDSELNTALAAAVPVMDVPATLDAGYRFTDDREAVVTALVSVPVDAIAADASGRMSVEVAGYVVNLDGKIGSRFAQRLDLTAADAARTVTNRGAILYRHQIKVTPGLYQVRVAVLDVNSRRTGSAADWITIPDLKTGQLTLSSFIIGERPPDTSQPYNAENFLVQRNAEHRFKRDTPLRFMIYIYNAKGAPPNLEAHIQVIRDEKAVVGYYNLKVEPGADGARGITYGAEVPLETLSPGRHVLQVTITNGPAEKQTARTTFIVE